MAVTFLASMDQTLSSQEEAGAQLVLVNRRTWILAGGEAGHKLLHRRGVPRERRGSGPLPENAAEANALALVLLHLVHT